MQAQQSCCETLNHICALWSGAYASLFLLVEVDISAAAAKRKKEV